MKFNIPALIVITIIMSGCQETKLNYPEAKKVDVKDTYFGVEVADPYRWLEDPDSQDTKAWVKAENELTTDYLSKIPFRDKIRQRLTEVFNYPKSETPFKKAGRYFFSQNDGLQNQNVLFYQDSLNGERKILIDPNKLSENGTIALSGYSISKNGEYIAYFLATGGSDWREIHVKEITTGKELPDLIKQVKFSSIYWHKNGFYYSSYPETEKSEDLTMQNKNQKIYYHKLGTDQSKDDLIYENPEYPDRIYRARVTDDEKYLIISESESTYGNQLYLNVLKANNKKFIPLTNSFDYENSIIGNVGDNLYLLTNNEAPKYKLQVLKISDDKLISKKDVIGETENLLESVNLAGDKLVAKYLVDVHGEVKLYDLKGNYQYDLTLPPLGDLNAFRGDYGENEAFYSFTSYTVPQTIFRYNVKENKSEVFFKPEIDFNSEDYVTSLDFYKSKDGTKIPLYIVHKKELKKDGTNPTLLYGYGGFNISVKPVFRTSLIPWLENGGIYAVANIRGGGEYGEEWHKAGTKLMKQNVFDDFIAAAEYLIDQKYTSSKWLSIEGRSNGGLLIGAVVNQRPDLFTVALPGVGVMDMLRFSRFTIGWAWETDYGSVKDSAEFMNLLKISPLHNIKSGVNYPATLAYTAERDDRVVPAHSFKYIATLQEKYTGNNPMLIRIQTDAGHGAGKPISKVIDERADLMAFTYYIMGINPYKK